MDFKTSHSAANPFTRVRKRNQVPKQSAVKKIEELQYIMKVRNKRTTRIFGTNVVKKGCAFIMQLQVPMIFSLRMQHMYGSDMKDA